MTAGVRGYVGFVGALGGLGCLGAFSFFVVGCDGMMEAGAEVLVLAWMFWSMLALRAAVVDLLGPSWLAMVGGDGFVRPTTRGLSWPPELERVSGVEGSVEGAMVRCRVKVNWRVCCLMYLLGSLHKSKGGRLSFLPD